MITTQSEHTATVYLNLPEDVVIISPSYGTPDGTPRYRMVAHSKVSADDARAMLRAAGLQVYEDASA
jgi:hypothetical protein